MADERDVRVPDIGGASGVEVIEMLVKAGDTVEIDTPLITLESDKASMEIPSPRAGQVKAVRMKIGDKVSEGDVILVLESEALASQVDEPVEIIEPPSLETPRIEVPVSKIENTSEIHASPSVRRLAREVGIDLHQLVGTGRKSRISKEDLQHYIQSRLQLGEKSVSLPAAPVIDFSRFGSVEFKKLNKIKRLTAENLHRAWATIPHVTQFDEADITELEAFRQQETNTEVKLTLLAFVCKTLVSALKAFPQFNSSLDATGESLIYKHYYNIGIAVETPNGLVVPVVKGVDTLSVQDIAKEMARLSLKAREKGLMPGEMNGGSFTISSLGGIGGTAFTPLVNSPEVAILGVSRAMMKPVYLEGEFKPRLMLPLSLSYDHRVIDGAEAARFTRYIAACLSDIRRILL